MWPQRLVSATPDAPNTPTTQKHEQHPLTSSVELEPFSLCVAIGSGKGLANLAKSVNVKSGINGPEEVRWALGTLLESDRSARTTSISQEAFIDAILARFNLLDATTVTTSSRQDSTFLWPTATSQDEIEEMATRPYRELVGALA